MADYILPSGGRIPQACKPFWVKQHYLIRLPRLYCTQVATESEKGVVVIAVKSTEHHASDSVKAAERNSCSFI